MKSAAGTTASLEDFQEYRAPQDRSLGALAGSRPWGLFAFGLLALSLAVYAAAAPGSLTSPAKASPLSGTWACSLGGASVGTLSVEGWKYVLGSSEGGYKTVGTLQHVVYGKYHEEYLKVQSGALKENFGVNLGYHYHLAGKPEAVVFNVGPEAGIRCTRT